MQSVASTGLLNRSWFDIKGPYAVLKPEHKEDMRTAIAAQKQKDTAALEVFRAEEKNREPIELTDVQKMALSEKYDPQNMTKEQYMEFVDKLYEYGIFDGNDRDFVGANELGLVRLDFSQSGAQIAEIPSGGLFEQFSSCGGNVLEWARYRATYQSFSELTMTFEPTRSALLFGRIEDVLDQLKSCK